MANIDVVIRIPEEMVQRFKNEGEQRHYDYHTVLKACINGIPLSKGHKRLIEDNFDVGPVFDKDGNVVGYQYVTQEDLNNALTIIEADKENEND